MFSSPELIVLDLEWTSWPGFMESGWSQPGRYTEIVHVGAFAVRPHENFQEVRGFERLVKPVYNPVLSDYFIDLTGIGQDRLDHEGVSFADMMTAFRDFCGETAAFASFGRDDLVMMRNCRYRDIEPAVDMSNTLNVNAALVERGLIPAGCTLSDLVDDLGLMPAGQAHDAVADARGLAALLRHFGPQLTAG
jgi:inhibitor of KinA sporulation pathway (predicted exonuclease)